MDGGTVLLSQRPCRKPWGKFPNMIVIEARGKVLLSLLFNFLFVLKKKKKKLHCSLEPQNFFFLSLFFFFKSKLKPLYINSLHLEQMLSSLALHSFLLPLLPTSWLASGNMFNLSEPRL
jgi:hypothetical protein